MNLSRVKAVVDRELVELRRNRLLLTTIAVPPLLLTLLPIGIVALLGRSAGNANLSADAITRYYQLAPELARFAPDELMQYLVLRQFLLFYLLMPLFIPVSIATYSIIGEKELRTLEPLLATPVRTGELLLGKSVAAIIPALLTTWASYAIFFALGGAVLNSKVFAGLIEPAWVFAMLVLAPLLCLLSVSLAIVVSSRVNDARSAQQIAGVIVIPLVVLAVGQTAGFFFLSAASFLLCSLVVALVDVGVLFAGVRLFQRETILTRWK